MSKTTGLTAYECDRCGRKDYLTSTDLQVRDWYDVTRVTTGSTTAPYVLCGSCWTDYQTLLKQQTNEFERFLAEKKE
ncbi:hypothetical protein [Bifidobacterium vansinderenii]|uniref:Uncharacterized protein n=1 Tax=Bifidobacterium vansinderenii TaxID=1984871 RepID=A0A229W0W8_9BIFI|nr:hypothetical protein [Bifidobacterium vansinderenii]OXN01491.1 hypothetical protein Tam10B_0494 [Bifidobacterium vansinderenii]